jgi:hypothetical protein
MLQVSEHRARPGIGRALELSQLLCCAPPRSANQISPTLGMAGTAAGATAGVGVSTAADLVALRWLCGYAQWFR